MSFVTEQNLFKPHLYELNAAHQPPDPTFDDADANLSSLIKFSSSSLDMIHSNELSIYFFFIIAMTAIKIKLKLRFNPLLKFMF